MNRRDFLKLAAAAPLVAKIPPPVTPDPVVWTPSSGCQKFSCLLVCATDGSGEQQAFVWDYKLEEWKPMDISQ